MGVDVHVTVKNRHSLDQDGPEAKHERQLQLFPAAGLLDFESINIW